MNSINGQQTILNKIMTRSKLESEKVLFKIDVKIGQRIITMNANEGDTIVQLLRKQGISHQHDPNRLNELREKIKLNIQKQIQIKLYSNQVDLANRMITFLQRENQNQQGNLSIPQQMAYKNSTNFQYTPFKILFEKTQNFKGQLNPNLSNSSNHQGPVIQTDNTEQQKSSSLLKSQSKPINQANHLNPKPMNLNQSKNNKSYSRFNQSRNKGSTRKADEDLIKAYELILKKSKDKAMREMAEKTLKQLNVYKNQFERTQIPLTNLTNQDIHKLPLGKDDSRDQKIVDRYEKKQIQRNKSFEVQQFSRSRSNMKKVNKYSYLEGNPNLSYNYKDKDHQEEKKQFDYVDDGHKKVQNLRKYYIAEEKAAGTKAVQNNRRFSYLDDLKFIQPKPQIFIFFFLFNALLSSSINLIYLIKKIVSNFKFFFKNILKDLIKKNRRIDQAFSIHLSIQMSLEKQMIKSMNRARQNPGYFVPILEKQIASFINDTEIPLNDEMIYETNEGKKAWIQALKFLKQKKAIDPLQEQEGLNHSAEDHAMDLSQNNIFGHTGSDGSSFSSRILRYCKKGHGLMAELIGADFCYQNRDHAQMTILGLIIDDGVSDRGHRKTIYDPLYKFIGCKSQTQEDKIITVFNITENKLLLRTSSTVGNFALQDAGLSFTNKSLKENMESTQKSTKNYQKTRQDKFSKTQLIENQKTNEKQSQFIRQNFENKMKFTFTYNNFNQTASKVKDTTINSQNRKLKEKKESSKIYYEEGSKVTEITTKLIYSDGTFEEKVQKHTIYFKE